MRVRAPLSAVARLLLRVLLLLGLLPAAVLAQDGGEAPRIALVTFGPGPVYWERFGHNALLVRDESGEALLYNYGVFDFAQKNFFLNFARGRMQYRLAVQRFGEALPQYAAEDRWLRVQQLNLTPAQARRLADYLRWNALPENAEYHYDYFLANCSTRVRDAIDMASDGQLRVALQAQAADSSYRFEATRLIAPVLPLALGMDLIMGAAGDGAISRWQQGFVPMSLMEALRGVQLRDAEGRARPLIAREFALLEASRWATPARPLPLRAPLTALGLGFALLLLGLARLRRHTAARYADALLSTLASLKLGLIGLVMLAVWTLTDHWVMWANHNLLLFNPLYLLLLPTLWRRRRPDWQPARWAARLSLLLALAGLAALPWLALPGAQQNLPWIAAVLPLQLVLAWWLRSAARA